MSDLLELKKEVQVLIKNENWVIASKKCASIREQYENSPFGYIQGGICLRELGYVERALCLFELSIKKFPDIAHPLIHKANILIAKKNFQAASSICEKLRLSFPETPFGFIHGGICHKELGDLEKAIMIWCSFAHKKTYACIGGVIASKSISPKTFELAIITLLEERFTLLSSSTLVNVVYRLYFSNRSAYKKVYGFLETIRKKIDPLTKLALGFEIDDTNLLDSAYSSGSLDIIKKIFSSHQNHKQNVAYLQARINTFDNPDEIINGHFNNRFDIEEATPTKSTYKKLKIAVCVSGQARGYELASKTWNGFFNKEHDFDFYCCLWSDMGKKGLVRAHLDRHFDEKFCDVFLNDTEGMSHEAVSLRYKNLYSLFNDSNELDITIVKAIYSPLKVDIVDSNQFSGKSNMYCMHYMIERCWKLIDDPAAYDLIIRIRPDKSINEININWNEVHNKCLKGVVIADVPASMHPNVGLVMGDQVAISTSDIMREYSTTFSKVESELGVFSKYKGYRSHMSLSLSMLENKINIVSLNTENTENTVFGPLIDTIRPDKKIILDALRKDKKKGIPFTDFEEILT